MVVVLVAIVAIVAIVVLPHIFPKKTLKSVDRPLSVSNGIPQVIFRTHKNLEVSESMYASCHEEWVRLNPKHSILWYTGEECEKFVENFGERVYKAYKTVRPGAFKADIWRACVLYQNGGIYIDSYSQPFCSISLMLQNCLNQGDNQFIAVLDKYGVHNGFLICTPKHPFLLQYILDMVENIENRFYGNRDLEITGPGCLWKSMNKTLGLKDKIFKEGKNNYGDLSFYLYRFSPGPSMFVYKKDIPILRKKYSLLELAIQKIFNFSSTYYSLWHSRKIYIEEGEQSEQKV